MGRGWPSLQAWADLFKHFQASLTPSTSEVINTFLGPSRQPADSAFRFAAAMSSNPVLSLALVECVATIKKKLGSDVQPDFCSLLITTEPYGPAIARAPAFLQEMLRERDGREPVLIGGAVQELLSASPSSIVSLTRRGWSPTSGQGVSLLAACLPGVSMHPFHVTSPSLPALPGELWSGLASKAHGSVPGDKSAAFLLSEPHFVQVDALLARLQNVLPNTPVVGGVLEPAAYGRAPLGGEQNSLRGALFLGRHTLDEGAVGCIMRGPLQLDVLGTQGCRPVGQAHTATRVQGNCILEVDGQPALKMLHTLFKAVKGNDKLLPVHIGIQPPGSSDGFLMRNIDGIAEDKMGVRLAVSSVAEGSLLQLHVRDSNWAKQELRSKLQEYAAELPATLQESPDSVGAIAYSCVGVSHDEQDQISSTVPLVAFQGAKCQAEFGKMTTGGGSHSAMCSYSTCLGILRQDPACTG